MQLIIMCIAGWFCDVMNKAGMCVLFHKPAFVLLIKTLIKNK